MAHAPCVLSTCAVVRRNLAPTVVRILRRMLVVAPQRRLSGKLDHDRVGQQAAKIGLLIGRCRLTANIECVTGNCRSTDRGDAAASNVELYRYTNGQLATQGGLPVFRPHGRERQLCRFSHSRRSRPCLGRVNTACAADSSNKPGLTRRAPLRLPGVFGAAHNLREVGQSEHSWSRQLLMH